MHVDDHACVLRALRLAHDQPKGPLMPDSHPTDRSVAKQASCGIDILKVHPKMGTAELPWPARKTAQAAGWDCCAAIDAPIQLWPGRLVKVPLGFALALPDGYEAQIRPRSGLASQGLTMPNSPGTVDADYRGEVSAIIFNLFTQRNDPTQWVNDVHTPGYGWLTIHPGDRIAQMVICKLPQVTFKEVDKLSNTARGGGGFGSTGTGAS